MSGKHYVAAVIALIAAPLILAVAACSSTSSHASGAASAIATSSAAAKAKNQATACLNKVPTTQLLTSSGRTEVFNCLKSLVPPDKVNAFKSCLTSAAASDKIWTSEGRAKFTGTSVPNCVTQVA